MLKSAERIEFLYSHFFDETIVNEDLETAFEDLTEGNRLANSTHVNNFQIFLFSSYFEIRERGSLGACFMGTIKWWKSLLREIRKDGRKEKKLFIFVM